MSSDLSERAKLVEALGRAMRVFSSQTVLYTQATADRLGMNLTDLLCTGILSITGPVTAGRLAELTGLTTGAITGVVDRMERAGYVHREADPNDRRRVIIRLDPENLQRQANPVFAPMLAATAEVMTRYSDEQLAAILDFVERSIPVLREETARLRGEATSNGPARGVGAAQRRARRRVPPPEMSG